MNILFIGAGRMAEAIFAGLIHNNEEQKKHIVVSNLSNADRLAELRERYGILSTDDWKSQVQKVEVILLAMSPEAHSKVLAELKPRVNGQLVVTVAAGMGTAKLQDALPAGTPVAWFMPNTAAVGGESMTLYACGEWLTDEHHRMIDTMLAAIGEAVECPEEQIHELTAITGSAPAFIYRFAEVMEEITMSFGIDRQLARSLVSQMIYGSGVMLKKGIEPEELRRQVTSPGGATAAGLDVLDEGDFRGLLAQAIKAVNARAEEQANSK